MNPYTKRLERAHKALAAWEAKQWRLDANAIPGTFVTGNSGVPAARRRKLDAQLDRTIDIALKVRYYSDLVRQLETSVRMYDDGQINAQGRSIRPKVEKPKAPKRPRKEISLAERLFVAHHATGFVYCDTTVEVAGDYKSLAHFSYATMKLTIYKGCSKAWEEYIRADIAQYKKGDRISLSASGQYTTWGHDLED